MQTQCLKNYLTHLRKACGLAIVATAALSFVAPSSMQAAFTIGNLAVEQLAQNNTSSTFSIVELSPYGTNAAPVHTISIPSTGTSALRQSSAASDGRLSLSADRTFLAFSGAQDGTGVADETTVLVRGVGTLDVNANYLMPATYTGVSGNQARSVTSLDNKTWYFGDKGGVYTNNETAAANSANVRPLKTFGGVVYALSANSPTAVMTTVSADGKTLTSLPGITAVDKNALDFYMVASGNNGVTNDIIYVDDVLSSGVSYVSKYSLVSGTWVSNGPPATLGFTGTIAADGICAIANGTGAFLFVTTGTGGTVVKVADTAGYNAAPSITPANNVVLYAGAPYLKGIDFAPLPNLATEQLAQNTTSSQFSIVELNPNTTNASAVNTITIPITGSSALRQANNGSTGRVALTEDRTLLAFTAAQDGTGVTDETTINLRGVGTIDSSASGDYTLQATYTGLGGSTKNQTRSATSLNNTVWYCGDKGGIYTNNTSNPVNTTNVRPIRVFGTNIYVCAATSGSATPSVISTLSVDATTLTPLVGLETSLDANAADFYMIQSGVSGSNFDIAYVNDGTLVSKYSLVSGSWVSNGPPAALGVSADGMCALNNGGAATLYVTTGTGGAVVKITDLAGWNQPPNINTANNTVLFASGTPYLKGLDFAPTAGSQQNNGNTPPVLVAATGATVDGPFIVTFSDSLPWRSAITNITVNSLTLSPSAYAVSAGQITFTPSASTLLQTAGTKTIVIGATAYNLDSVSQPLGAGAPTQLAITAQPGAPAGNGGTLVAQPVVQISDQYGNSVTNAATFTASVGAGAWSFGAGSGVSQAAVNGTASFTNLSTSSSAAVSGAIITFTVTGTGLGALPSSTINSASFNIPAPATAFTPGNLAVEQEDIASKNSTFSMLELSPTAVNQAAPVNTFAITATGPNALRQTSAATTGRLATSADGTLLCFAAFEDGSSLTADEATVDPRGVGTLDAYGNYVLQTSYVGLGDATGNQARSATTLDDVNYYIGDKGGVYMNNETAGNPFIGGTGSNVRSLKPFGGTVYALQQFSANLTATVLQEIYVNNGAAELYPIAGFPEDANVLDFYMLKTGNNGDNFDVVYYIDGTNSTSGTLFKYILNGTDDNGFPAYQQAGPGVLTTNGGDGMCAAINPNGGVDIYYTTGSGGAAGNSLYTVHDASAWNAPINLTSSNILYNAPALATLKGVAFAPVAPPSAPAATTLPATAITTTGAILSATVNPNGAVTTVQFSYGTTPSYGNVIGTTTVPAGFNPVTVTMSLAGLLTPGTGYHFQVQANNSVATTYGADASFTTLSPTATPPQIGGLTINSGKGLSFTFTNTTGLSFSVLATNDLTVPIANWPVIGTATENPAGSGQYQFSDLSAQTNTMFYILRQP